MFSNPVTTIKKDLKKEEKKIKDDVKKIEYDIDLAGEYLLFGAIAGLFIGIPLINELSKKIPEAIEQAAKIADIVKPI